MKTVFLDTETTGLDDDAQAVEIAIVDDKGEVIFESLVKPTVPVDPGAAAIHGISADKLASAPAWPDIAEDVKAALAGNQVVIFNAEFDTRILKATAAAHGDPAEWLDSLETDCAMHRAADIYGSTNRYGTISLINAADRAGVEFQGQAHSAAGDAATTALVWWAMAKIERRRETDRKRRERKKAELAKQDAKPNRLSPKERAAVEALRDYVSALANANLPEPPAGHFGVLEKMGLDVFAPIRAFGADRALAILDAILAGKTTHLRGDDSACFYGLGIRLSHVPHTQVASVKRGKSAAFTAQVPFGHPNQFVAGKTYRAFMPWQIKELKKPK